MKKLLFLLVISLFSIGTKAQFVTIPDANFAQQLRGKYPQCMNGNQLDTTCTAIVNETMLDVIYKSIADMSGVEYFDNLVTLNCGYNTYQMKLSKLPPKLVNLDITMNRMYTMDAPLPATLKKFKCGYSYFTSLPALPAGLVELECYNSIDLGSLPALPATLQRLHSSGCPLGSLPALPASLTYLECDHCRLNSLPALPNSLVTLIAYQNYFNVVPTLPNSLDVLSLGDLTSLPNLPPSLSVFTLGYCPNIKCLPPLQKFTGVNGAFDISGTGVTCLPNFIQHSVSIPAIDTMPVCDLLNANGCPGSVNIAGRLFVDDNRDCIKQGNEQSVFSIKVNLYKNGTLSQSGIFPGGSYSFAVGAGTYRVSLDTTGIPFSISCPAGGDTTVTITTLDSATHNIYFGLQCKQGFDIGATSVHSFFRPGSTTQVKTTTGNIPSMYGATCAAGVSGTVQLSVTGPVQYVSPAPGAITPASVAGNNFT